MTLMAEFKGRVTTLNEIARITGHSYSMIKQRYEAGDRGECLVRPKRSEKPRSPYVRKPESLISRLNDSANQLRRERIKAIRAEHAAAFSRPLIDSSLLTDSQRREIAERVRCGLFGLI